MDLPNKNKKVGFWDFAQHFLIFFMCLAGFLFPDVSFAWFSEDGKEEMLFLNPSISSDISFSDTYVLPYNMVGQKRNSSITPDSKLRFCVVADRVNLDISLNILSKNAIDPSESIDRLLAVNLRIKNILDEYTKLSGRAELLLNDFSNSNLSILIPKKKNKSISSIQSQSVLDEKTDLKKKLANVVNNSLSNKVNLAENNQKTLIVLSRLGVKGRLVNSTSSFQTSDSAPAPGRQQKTSNINDLDRFEGQPPWIVNFILKRINYCIDHKVAMISLVLLIFFFIALIPMRGRR